MTNDTQAPNPITIVDDAIDKQVASYLDRSMRIVKTYSAFKVIGSDQQLATFFTVVLEVAKLIRDEDRS